MRSTLAGALVMLCLLAAGCGSSAVPAVPAVPTSAAAASPAEPAPAAAEGGAAEAPAEDTSPDAAAGRATDGGESPGPDDRDEAAPATVARPAWLGTRALPVGLDGLAAAQPTPPELDDRRLPPPPSDLPAPAGEAFAATIAEVPADVLARSTWTSACPVAAGDLRHVLLTFWGFDDRVHTGELLVHADVAEDVVGVFGALHAARFPLEEVRVIGPDELDAPPTGDGNVTTGFVCRDTRGASSWSQHAYGLAVDLNPFHNPYVKGGVVLPELATSYTDRRRLRPGMIESGDAVTAAFAAIGWGWGGDWSSLTDPMHFSRNGR